MNICCLITLLTLVKPVHLF